MLLAAAAEHPLIDLDLTLLIQLGVFGITAFIGSKLLFKPYLALRDHRSERIEGGRLEAERFQAQAEASLADYRQKLDSARGRALANSRKLQAEAATKERSLATEARQKAGALLDEGRNTIATQVDEARRTLAQQADSLGEKVAAKLLRREVN